MLLGTAVIRFAFTQKIICPFPRPTEAASSISSCVKAEPFQVAPRRESRPVSISSPTHLPLPCAALVEANVFRSSRAALITILLPLCSTVTAS